ncbi:putative Phosphoadenylyl-sulfate reductase (thioredoxin) [Rhodotorula taiwanensis]|uniref:Putative Phosphoadenylyl-sulfate reductase (Thioredoxin) n=1 Tax=Rhodotorula taiwanensis TaxID=741276 RepID=A0A2S5B826_9BASI|nr:putative Phosphoadenylyl-sulfate reductase (thioredoxin) [Rhodotorula taiwanensis]
MAAVSQPIASTSALPPAVPAASSTTAPAATAATPRIFDRSQLADVNAQLADATPQGILAWAIDHVPGLYQTTAFGLTGLAATDMIANLSKRRKTAHLVPLIFLDTLYHFDETMDLARRVEKKYKAPLHIFRPPGVETTKEFEAKYGERLWETDEDTYDYLVKVEPARRAYEELGVKAVITGRRRSQGADRAALEPVEIDSTGLIKINPLCRWGFQDVKDYIEMAGVPYNPLLDQGYKSIGDRHSTVLPKDGEGERSGRWASNKTKTECGLHKDYFAMKRAFEKKQLEQERAAVDKARGDDEVGESSISFDDGEAAKSEDLGASFSDLKLGA